VSPRVRGAVAAGLLGLLVATARAADKTPVTPDLVLSYWTGDLNAYFSALNVRAHWLPDSKRVVFSVPDPEKPDRLWIQICDVDAGACRRLFEGSDPVPSPDGKTLAFMRGKDAERQIWTARLDGGGEAALTKHPGGLSGWAFGMAWSPDSSRIAFLATPERDKEQEQKRQERDEREKAGGSTVVVYGSKEERPQPAEIWVVDAGTRTSRRVGSWDTSLYELSWFPDGKRLLVYGWRWGAAYHEPKDDSDVIVVDAATGTRTNVVRAGGEEMYAAASPDGRRVGFFYDADDVRYPDLYSVAVVPSSGGGVRELTPKLVASDRPIWSPDGSSLYFIARSGAFSQIERVALDGRRTPITTAAANHKNASLSPDGRRLAWYEQLADGRARVVAARADGSDPRMIVNLTPQFDGLALGVGREVRWKSTDGVEIAGILVEPPGPRVPGRPLVVEPHGGPIGGLSIDGQLMCIGPLERSIWTNKGYVVFAPDFRTSGVYGWDKILAGREKGDFMERDFDDIMTGVDALVKDGTADPNRMVVGGHSYGAVESEWILTHSHRFRAAVIYEGAGDWYRAYGDLYSVGGNTSLAWQFKGRPWETPETYFKNSPLFMMKGATIPTMFIVGDGAEYGGSNASPYEFMYSALKQQGVETQMLVYKKEGHVVFKPANVRDLTGRIVKWIDDHLAPRPERRS
jgi:dipeptidyl aminopeptidase/acylaminoacyl peptidase